MRRLPGALIAVLLALAACGALPADELQPSGTSTSSNPEEMSSPASNSASPSSTAASATPAEVPQEQQFGLDDDAAEFDDGLVIEIAGDAVADKASEDRPWR